MTDNPDVLWRDFRNHLYYPAAPDGTINGVRGTADERVEDLYGQVVELLRDGDAVGASRVFGALSHYSNDIENPLHTGSDLDEEAVHQKYEAQVLTRTDLRPRGPEFVSWDGYDPVPNPATWARENAEASHAGYRSLIDAYFAWWAAGNTGMPTAVEGMTEGYLDAASNHLADLMVQAAVDAGIVAAPEGTPEGSLEESSGTPQGDEPAATETWWDRFLGWLASFLGL